MRTIALMSLLGVVAAMPALAQDFDAVEIRTTDLGGGIYMLQGAGGNLGLSVGEDGVFLIDDDYAPLAEKIREAIAVVTDQPVGFLINTHWHGDHTGGNENLGSAGVTIFAHDNVRARLLGQGAPAVALPVVTFNDTTTFHMNGQTIHVFHAAAAHTDGDALIHFREADVIHMGDTYFNGFYPFIDVASGGSLDGTLAAADQALALADDKHAFAAFCARAGVPAVPSLAVYAEGRPVEPFAAGQPPARDLVIKPRKGARTEGVEPWFWHGGAYHETPEGFAPAGPALDPAGFERRLVAASKAYRQVLVQPMLRPHPALRVLAGTGVPTARVVSGA